MNDLKRGDLVQMKCLDNRLGVIVEILHSPRGRPDDSVCVVGLGVTPMRFHTFEGWELTKV